MDTNIPNTPDQSVLSEDETLAAAATEEVQAQNATAPATEPAPAEDDAPAAEPVPPEDEVPAAEPAPAKEDAPKENVLEADKDFSGEQRSAAAEPAVPEEPEIPVLPLPAPVSDLRGTISAFGYSQQGESHLKKDTPCQDRCGLRFIRDDLVIAAIADGVGSCALSDYGSDTAVTASLDFLEERLNADLESPGFTLDDKYMGKVLREMMQHAYDQVKKKAAQMEQLLYSMQSTLTVSVYNGKVLYFAHAGDDGIVALTSQGKYEMVTSRHKGEEASSVYPLQNVSTWQYGKVNDTVGFVMATDGVLDAFVRNEVEGNRIYYPFLEPVFNTVLLSPEDAAAACADWHAYMQTPGYRQIVTDDLTFVCIVNQKTIREMELPRFDMEAWEKKSKEYEARRRAVLYPPRSVVKNAPKPSEPREKPNFQLPKDHERPAAQDSRKAPPAQPNPTGSAANGTAPDKGDDVRSERIQNIRRLTGDIVELTGSALVVGCEIISDWTKDSIIRIAYEISEKRGNTHNDPAKNRDPGNNNNAGNH